MKHSTSRHNHLLRPVSGCQPTIVCSLAVTYYRIVFNGNVRCPPGCATLTPHECVSDIGNGSSLERPLGNMLPDLSVSLSVDMYPVWTSNPPLNHHVEMTVWSLARRRRLRLHSFIDFTSFHHSSVRRRFCSTYWSGKRNALPRRKTIIIYSSQLAGGLRWSRSSVGWWHLADFILYPEDVVFDLFQEAFVLYSFSEYFIVINVIIIIVIIIENYCDTRCTF